MKRIKLLRLFLIISLWVAAVVLLSPACQTRADSKVEDLRTEYMSNPLGVDVPIPGFSWKIISEQRNVVQQAYRIIVGEDSGEINRKEGKSWDTGKISGGETVNHEYAGTNLKSSTKYWWRVCVWLDEERCIWSDPASFYTGIFDVREWKAQWITPEEKIIHQSPLLRKEFVVGKKIREAYAYVSACGFYEFFLNGEKVGDHMLDPGITDYRKTILYATYDVTRLLKRGSNAAGAMLGNGAWNLLKTEGRWSWGSGGSSFGNPCFFMQLMVTCTDGSRMMVVTDNSWKTAMGPVTFNNLYGGEDYDARKEVPGWSSPRFIDSSWTQAVVSDKPTGRLKSQLMPPIRVTQTLRPAKKINPSPGLYLFDLEQNIAGWWKMRVKGSPGQVLRIRGAETLNDSLFSQPLKTGDKLSVKQKYHAQTWTDYTIGGNKTEVYEPRFFYTGFRYIEVATSDGKNPELLEIEGRVAHSDLEKNGAFDSSDTLLNRINRAGIWSQRGNMFSYPTDCPHREKGAYNGDGQVIAEASFHDFNMAPFYTKWVNDMRDSQEENGRIPNTSPTLVGGMGGGVAWGSAYILIPWWMNHYYGDTRILKEHYPTMKKYLGYLKNLGASDEDPSEPYIIDNFSGYWYSLGEWCAPGPKNDCPNHPVVNTFYYYYNNLLFSKIAGILGNPEDEKYFLALADTIKNAFNRKFYDTGNFLYGTGETFQTYQLLALTGGLVPEENRDEVFNTIVEDIKKRDDHLNTGIIGTKYLWPVLVNGGENELAYRVATQTTFPGYGYWINNGSTTLLEEWSARNSHNHQMFGSVTEYFYKFLAGIQSPADGGSSRAYTRIFIEPHMPDQLKYASASLKTISGTVSSGWEKIDRATLFRISIPANTTAILSLPVQGQTDFILREGNSQIWSNGSYKEGVPGILGVKNDQNRLLINTASGNYVFRIETE